MIARFDITEICPIFDVSGTTSRLAVCVVLRVLASMACGATWSTGRQTALPGLSQWATEILPRGTVG